MDDAGAAVVTACGHRLPRAPRADELRYATTYISRFTIRDGLIVRLAEHFAPVALVTALGGTVEMPSA